ncbi:MAG: YggT family protein [Syntrophales bacterium]|jgi:YggT family protein|nr:YggT family protein [Syntrophales bacterium]MCK9528280.1 YggT family protein [Syntrophales bacterium]MDX9922412.1 YggT family protein [Syntrophales bacterium]
MFVLANFVEATARVVQVGLTLYMWVVIIRALLSWVNPDPYNPIVRTLHRVTEPVLYRVRRLIPTAGLGIDLSPVIVILAIFFLQSFLVKTLLQIALALR